MRVASEDAFFACPEIDRGVLAGGGSFFTRLNMPSGPHPRDDLHGPAVHAREELQQNTGFFNYVVPKDQVMPQGDGARRRSSPARAWPR